MRTVTLRVEGRVPSWNEFYKAGHWSDRNAKAHLWHALVHEAIGKLEDATMFDGPVNINIWAYYSHHVKDSDNICAKLLIDGLKGKLIQEDDPKWVRTVSVTSTKADVDLVDIEIWEASNEPAEYVSANLDDWDGCVRDVLHGVDAYHLAW